MLPTDLINLIHAFLPSRCDYCNSCCNYEVKEYRHLYRSGRRQPIFDSIFMCRICKLSKFNFDKSYIWPRTLETAREVDIMEMSPCVRLKKYICEPYGMIIDEPRSIYMPDYHWDHNRNFRLGFCVPVHFINYLYEKVRNYFR